MCAAVLLTRTRDVDIPGVTVDAMFQDRKALRPDLHPRPRRAGVGGSGVSRG